MKNNQLVNSLEEYKRQDLNYKLPIMLGVDSSGKFVFADLVNLKHILIAGETGSGKSVFVNSLIISLMLLVPPTDVNFMMIDMKRVELNIYNGSPFILGKVMVEGEDVISNLKLLLKEKERRLNLNEDKLVYPYIVLVVDTFSDLMYAYQSEFENLIIELSRNTEKSKIHIIACDSRSSVEVFTQSIKDSFPTRLVGKTTHVTDSQTVLGMVGAEKLSSQGDMLFLPPHSNKPIHIQTPWVSYEEVKRLLSNHKKQK